MAHSTIRTAISCDAVAIEIVHLAAFPADAEARLVALLAERGKAVVSLVAVADGRIVGHVLFSPATIENGPLAPSVDNTGLGLAPLAVLPEFQNQGIGSALVRVGLAECRRLGVPWVVVLGHPSYYPRFGFAPASRWNLTCEFGGGDAFQFLPLSDTGRDIHDAHVFYASEFSELFGSA